MAGIVPRPAVPRTLQVRGRSRRPARTRAPCGDRQQTGGSAVTTKGALCGLAAQAPSDRSPVSGVPARGEQEPADARRRAAALRKAGRRRAGLRARAVRLRPRATTRSCHSSSSTPTARSRRPASCSGARTSSSTSSTTSATTRCRRPGRVRELLELCSRLHSTRLDWERPLWEAHLIEGLADGRVAMYTKIHHGLVDGISAMRLMQSTLSTDPDERGMAAPWAKRAIRSRPKPDAEHADDRGRAHARRAPGRRAADGDRRHRRGRRHAGRADQDAVQGDAQRGVDGVVPHARARCSTARSPAPAGSPPRTGRSSGSARSARRPGRRSTTSCSRCAAARSAPTSSRTTRSRTPRSSRWCPSG